MQRFVAFGITAIFLSLSAIGQEAAQTESVNCAESIEKPAYPRPARIANISGSVVAHFAIGSSGTAEGVRLEGHPILTKEVESAILRTKFPDACQSQRIELRFEFRLEGSPSDEPRTSVVFDNPNRYVDTSDATGVICVLITETKVSQPQRNSAVTSAPRFSDLPASSPYDGPIAVPKIKRRSDEQRKTLIERAVKQGPNFAGHYILAKFQIGDGPIGAVVVDAKSGSVFHLPSQVVKEDFFIYNTDCLALYGKWRSSTGRRRR